MQQPPTLQQVLDTLPLTLTSRTLVRYHYVRDIATNPSEYCVLGHMLHVAGADPRHMCNHDVNYSSTHDPAVRKHLNRKQDHYAPYGKARTEAVDLVARIYHLPRPVVVSLERINDISFDFERRDNVATKLQQIIEGGVN